MTRKQGRGPSRTPPPPKAPPRSAKPRGGQFIGRRFIAMSIDASVLTSLIESTGVGSPVGRWLIAISLVAAIDWVGVARFGTTPGKALLGLRVQSIDNKPVGLRRAAMRTGIKQLPMILTAMMVAFLTITGLEQTRSSWTVFSIGWVVLSVLIYGPALMDEQGRGHHDRWAATRVTAVRGASWAGRRQEAMQGLVSQDPLDLPESDAPR